MRSKTGLLLVSMVSGALLVGALPVTARQLANVEAEQATVGIWAQC